MKKGIIIVIIILVIVIIAIINELYKGSICQLSDEDFYIHLAKNFRYNISKEVFCNL